MDEQVILSLSRLISRTILNFDVNVVKFGTYVRVITELFRTRKRAGFAGIPFQMDYAGLTEIVDGVSREKLKEMRESVDTLLTLEEGRWASNSDFEERYMAKEPEKLGGLSDKKEAIRPHI